MTFRDDLNLAGRLTLQLRAPDGRLLEETTAHNDITINGRNLVSRLFNRDQAGADIKRVTKIKVGGSQAAFDPRQTGLGQLVGETPIVRIEPVEMVDPSGRPRMMLRLTGELGEDDLNAELREAGLFTEDGVMYNRVTFDTITKSNQFKLTLVWEITF